MNDEALYVNYADGVKRVMNNSALYARLLAKFRDGPGIAALEAAFSGGDLRRVQGETHTLKGVAANLSLEALAAACLALEERARAGELDGAGLESLRAVFAATLGEIDRVTAANG